MRETCITSSILDLPSSVRAVRSIPHSSTHSSHMQRSKAPQCHQRISFRPPTSDLRPLTSDLSLDRSNQSAATCLSFSYPISAYHTWRLDSASPVVLCPSTGTHPCALLLLATTAHERLRLTLPHHTLTALQITSKLSLQHTVYGCLCLHTTTSTLHDGIFAPEEAIFIRL